MELFLLSSLIIGVLFLFLVSLFLRQGNQPKGMPPGKMGWPVVGETLEFLANGRRGLPYKFIFDRLSKYAPSRVFKTSILGEKVIVMCGASSHKFLYSNESKLVQGWWPKSITKIFPSAITALDDSKKLRKFLPTYLKPEALQRYIPVMDTVAIRYMKANWEGKDKVVTYPLSKHYTFLIACRLFLSVEDPAHVATFEEPHNTITAGMIAMPIQFPGTRFYRAIKASRHIKELFKAVIKQRKLDIADGKATPTQDILSHMLQTPAPDGEFMNEFDIANKILGLIIGGHTASTTLTFILHYLSQLPHIYNKVYEEQMEIAKSKKPGELLNWDDIQKMKYSWNVACEAMRLTPPVQGSFREAITDFTYDGFHIPKGWKLYWSGHSTGRDPKVFPDPEKFDPTRFEGTGPAPYTFVPFGGGPRMCPGNEYARLEILVFMHNLVKRFKWERVYPNERVVVNPMPQPEHGLPIRLIPHPKPAAA